MKWTLWPGKWRDFLSWFRKSSPVIYVIWNLGLLLGIRTQIHEILDLKNKKNATKNNIWRQNFPLYLRWFRVYNQPIGNTATIAKQNDNSNTSRNSQNFSVQWLRIIPLLNQNSDQRISNKKNNNHLMKRRRQFERSEEHKNRIFPIEITVITERIHSRMEQKR